MLRIIIKQKVLHVSGWPCKRCTTEQCCKPSLLQLVKHFDTSQLHANRVKENQFCSKMSLLQCFSAGFCDRLEIAMPAWDGLETNSAKDGFQWIWSTSFFTEYSKILQLSFITGCSTISNLPETGWRKFFCCTVHVIATSFWLLERPKKL